MRPAAVSQFARFVAVGALNTGFSYALYAAGLWLGFHYAAANFMAVAIGTIFSFITQGRLVFANSDPRRFWRFLLTWALLWLVNVALIGALIRFAGVGAYVAGAIALVPVVILSFFLQKGFVFKKRPET